MIDYTVVSLYEIINSGIDVDLEIIKQAFEKFSCNREKDLENFLVSKAFEYEKSEFGKTFLLIDEQKLNDGSIDIVAFFVTGQKPIDISEMSKKQRKKVIGNYPGRDSLSTVPAFLIGQLGRSDHYSRYDIDSETILMECFHQLKKAQMVVGGKMVVLECREPLLAFYEKNNFKRIDHDADNQLYTLCCKMN